MSNIKQEFGKPISRQDAISISDKILKDAEEERSAKPNKIGIKYKIRLIWRASVVDDKGSLAEHIYKTDVIDLPDDAQAFQFPGVDKTGWLPELVGGEWLNNEN